MQSAKATIDIVIEEAFKKTSIHKIESIVRQTSPQKDELAKLETTITSLTEKIKEAKQISEINTDDNTKPFYLKRQKSLPLKSLVNAIRCSSITKEEVLTLLHTPEAESGSTTKQQIVPENIPEIKNLSVRNFALIQLVYEGIKQNHKRSKKLFCQFAISYC